MSFHIDISDIIRRAGFEPVGKSLITGGRLVLRQNISYKDCEIKAVFFLTFEHQNIITAANYAIEDIAYGYIEELSPEEFQQTLNSKLRECCNNLIDHNFNVNNFSFWLIMCYMLSRTILFILQSCISFTKCKKYV